MANAQDVRAELETVKNELAGAKPVPYIVHESAQARQERHIKRLIIALIISIILMFSCNIAWLYAWCQYDYTSTETTYAQDGKGTNIIGDSNEANNDGANESYKNPHEN
jgi:hypothetical protein